jgi:hypothetical protein
MNSTSLGEALGITTSNNLQSPSELSHKNELMLDMFKASLNIGS